MSASLVEQTVDRALEGRRAAVAGEVRRLVEAALTLIQRTGEFEPTVGAIVKESGLSNQVFYRHFRSKHQLLVAVLDEGIRLLAGYLAHRMAAANSPEARIREWIRGMLEQAVSRQGANATRPFVRARGKLAESFPGEVAQSELQVTALLKEAIADGVASGAIPHARPAGDSETLYHMTLGWVEARLLEAGPPSDADDASEARARRDAARLEAFAIAGLRRAADE